MAIFVFFLKILSNLLVSHRYTTQDLIFLLPPSAAAAVMEALKGVCDIPLSQLPNPVIKGDIPSITIPEEEYEAGITECKNNLHGRVLWPKGSSPLTVAALKEKLSTSWSEVKNWGMLSLGKGYYEFTFATTEDMRREYWKPRIVFAIASCVGTPICIDAASSKSRIDHTFGQYVRVLVDMDLTKPLNHNVLVERKSFAFFADIEYENLPPFCDNCKRLGHVRQDCKLLQKHPAPAAPRTKAVYILKQNNKSVEPVTDTHASLERVIQPTIESQVPEDPIIVPNPLNFISQPLDDSETQLTEVVEATHVKESPMNNFLHNSWAELADLEEEQVDKDGAFTNAVSILKKKQAARIKAKRDTRSQAGPVLSLP
ncbi:uncharacterized protein LOC131642405 [Vicia villosa]|uniref:uncharacterized protein LOC131642405 n=1 Tax=Vicia villosa TaxID=3911 RepID=UPI00273A7BCC|nr:uncharacterized protein LOC131642405 [Vicia villosa]